MKTQTIGADIGAVMDQMPYGLYIIGSRSDIEANGMMADWVMQVSFNPRLVAVALENDAHTLANLRSRPFFTVNFLPEDSVGMQLAARFAQPYFGSKIAGRVGGAMTAVHHKLDGISYWTTNHGSPVLELAMAWLECQAETFVPVGDHHLVLGRVIDGGVVRSGDPLTSDYTGWTYSG